MCFVQVHDPDLALTIATQAASNGRNDVASEGFRRITVGAADQHGTSVVPEPPAAGGPGETNHLAASI